jgi:transcriptional regulator with XRE-family HTH domain
MVSYIQQRHYRVEAKVRMQIAQKFERLLAMYRHPDGRRWSGQEIDEATGGVVTRSYVTNLKKGRIENPGFEKLRAIAKVMGFSPELWFEQTSDFGTGTSLESLPEDGSIADRANRLFDVVRNEKSGMPFTNAEVARMSLGDLSEEHLEQIRSGNLTNPSMNQVIALADVFGVHPSYFLDAARKPPLLDADAMRILQDETVSAIAHKSLHLPGRERQMILNIIQQFEDTQGADGGG